MTILLVWPCALRQPRPPWDACMYAHVLKIHRCKQEDRDNDSRPGREGSTAVVRCIHGATRSSILRLVQKTNFGKHRGDRTSRVTTQRCRDAQGLNLHERGSNELHGMNPSTGRILAVEHRLQERNNKNKSHGNAEFMDDAQSVALK